MMMMTASDYPMHDSTFSENRTQHGEDKAELNQEHLDSSKSILILAQF